MDISEAISIFGFEGLSDITKENVTKKYRQLMKVNHPDIGGDERLAIKINEAQEILTQVLEQITILNKLQEMSNKPLIFTIIPLSELVKVYKGEVILLKFGEDKFVLNRKNIRAHKVVLDISCSIQVDGIDYKFSTLSQMNIKDEYSIRCVITDTNISEDRKVNIKAYGKDVNLTVRGIASTMVLNYEGLVKLNVTVERRVVDNG